MKLVTGGRSQTVNVYDADEREGQYELKLRGTIANRVEGSQLREFESVPDMIRWLRSRGFQDESTLVGATPSPLDVQLDSGWLANLRRGVEQAINDLVDEFVKTPYLHRVEHSLHCELYRLLTERCADFASTIKAAAFQSSSAG